MRLSESTSPLPADPARTATWTGLVAVVFWSVSVGLIRSVSELLGPIGGAATIFTASGILACVFLGLPRPRSFHRVYLFIGGALFVAYEIALSLALGFASSRAQSLELGMINYLWPSLTILLAVLCGQQKGSLLLWPGAALSFLGIGWVMKGDGAWSPALFWQNVLSNPLAYGLALAGAFLWAAYSVLTRRFGGGKGSVSLFLLVTSAALWIHYALSAEPALRFSVSAALQVLVMSGLTVTAYACWNFGIQKGHIARLAVASYFTPVLSVLLASLWLQVRPAMAFWQGVAMVTLGSLVCWWSTRRTSARA